jgi:hypothetical protein
MMEKINNALGVNVKYFEFDMKIEKKDWEGKNYWNRDFHS